MMMSSATLLPETFALPFLGNVGQSVTFPNGHTLVFVKKPGLVFNVSTWVKTGSINEDEINNGISHFLEHLMFKGTQRMKPGEFDRAMESMGAVINAATWKDFTFYYVTGPNQGVGEFERALDLHADMMLHSTLPDSEIGPAYDHTDAHYKGEKRERTVVIEEIGMREDQPWTKVYNSINALMYPEGHPYRRDVIGTRGIIAGIPRKAIEGYYRYWYSPGQMTTIVVGDFDFETLKEKLTKAFHFDSITFDKASLEQYAPPTEDPSRWNGVFKEEGSRFEQLEGPNQTHFFMLGFAGPRVDNLKDSIALDVALNVLGDGRSSRLQQNLIEKPETPNFNFLNASQSTFRLGNCLYIQGNFNETNVQGSLQEVKDELARFLGDHPIQPEEFSRAVKKLKIQFAEQAEQASGISDALGDAITVAGGLSGLTDYLPTLESLTLEQVQSTAQRYLDPGRAYGSVLVPAANTTASAA
jgi:zinc protease